MLKIFKILHFERGQEVHETILMFFPKQALCQNWHFPIKIFFKILHDERGQVAYIIYVGGFCEKELVEGIF